MPYLKNDKFKFLGMYGESPDISGGMGGEGVDAFAKFLDAGGTLITMGERRAIPDRARLGAHGRRVGLHVGRVLRAAAARQRRDRPKPDHPVFYGYADKIMPDQVPRRAADDASARRIRASVLARYVGGDAAVLSGLMSGADEIRDRAVRGRRRRAATPARAA